LRCASAIQIVRPLESIAETHPQLQPALLRLSAMISQYFAFDGSSFSRRRPIPIFHECTRTLSVVHSSDGSFVGRHRLRNLGSTMRSPRESTAYTIPLSSSSNTLPSASFQRPPTRRSDRVTHMTTSSLPASSDTGGGGGGSGSPRSCAIFHALKYRCSKRPCRL